MKKFYVILFLLVLPIGIWAQGTPVATTNWTVNYVDSQQSGYEATRVFDGDVLTEWHTEWDPTYPDYPHTLIIDMNTVTNLWCLSYVPRDYDWGWMKDYKISVSVDEANWTVVSEGILPQNGLEKFFWFEPTDAQFLKFEFLSSYQSVKQAIIHELRAYSTPDIGFTNDKSKIYSGETVHFKGTTAKSAIGWSWTFPGGTPETATTREVDVVYNTPGKYDVTLNIDHGNSDVSTLTNVNAITVGIDDPMIPKTDWQLVSVTSEIVGNDAIMAFDNDINTVWHTDWVNPVLLPHAIVVDLGQAYTLTSFSVLPRQSGETGKIKDWEFWTSLDGITFTKSAEGAWNVTTDLKREFIIPQVEAQFIKLIATSNFTGDAYASVAEFSVYGPIPAADFTWAFNGLEVAFTGSATLNPTGYKWVINGASTSTSTEKNLTVNFDQPGVYEISFTASYSDQDIIVNKTINVTGPEIPSSNWTVFYVDSEELIGGSYPATNAIDGNIETFWHTQWSEPVGTFPHELQVDMGENFLVNSISMLPRQDGNPSGRFAGYEILYSLDGLTWTSADTGTWENTPDEKIEFFTPVKARYLSLKGRSEVYGNVYGALAEFKAFGTSTVSVNETKAGNSVLIYSYNNNIYVTVDNQAQVEIFNLSGQKVQSQILYAGRNTLTQGKSGVYLIKVISDNELTTKKVFVK